MNKLLVLAALSLFLPGPVHAAWNLSEPSSILLIAIGLVGIIAIVHRRNRK